jgi:hypothetical protein
MMFLFRTAFWLVILILLLPTDEDQQKRIYGTAQAAVNDVASFCDRNPQTCAAGQDAFAVLVQKARYGAQMLVSLAENKTTPFGMSLAENKTTPFGMSLADNKTTPLGDSAPGPVAMSESVMSEDPSVMPVPAAAPLEPATWDASTSQDTLTADDRAAAWDGPGV